MTDRLITVNTTDVEDGSPVVIVIGSPVGETYGAEITANQATFIIPDTVLLNSYVDLQLNATVTSGGYSVTKNVIITPDNSVDVLDVAQSATSFVAVKGGNIVSSIEVGSDHSINIDWLDASGNFVGQQDTQYIAPTVTAGTISYIRTTGVTNIYSYTPPANTDTVSSVTFEWGRYADFSLTEATYANKTMQLADVVTGPVFNGVNGTLSGATHIFSWSDPSGVAGRRYDLYVNGVDQGPSVVYPANSVEITGLPINGSTLTIELHWWDNDDLATKQTITMTVTAHNAAPPSGSQFIIPVSDVGEGQYNNIDWTAGIGDLSFIFWEPGGDGITSVSTIDGRRALGVRLDNTASPSTRVGAGARLVPAQKVAIEQWVYFDAGFDWGGTNEGGKLGFGLGGGSRPSGNLTSQDGFSARFMWRTGGGIYCYVYDGSTAGYGDDYALGFTAPKGEWFKLKMEIQMNTNGGVADGTLQAWANDVLLVDRSDMEWFGAGSPQIDALTHFTFHGGNDSTWTPSRENHVYFADIYWATDDQITVPPATITNARQNMAQTAPTNLRVQWDVSPASGAQLQWRVKNSGSAYTDGPIEATSYPSHNYLISGLTASTEYEVVINSGGSVVVIYVLSADPIAAPVDAGIPFNGLFGGAPHVNTYGPGNTGSGVKLAIRVWLQAGTYVGYANSVRYLRSKDVTSRAAPGNIYQQILDAGMNDTDLRRNKCGSAFGSSQYSGISYIGGNGGSYTVEIRPVNMTNLLPDESGSPMATTAPNTFIPIDHPQGGWPYIPFASPLTVGTAGWHYIVLTNTKQLRYEDLPVGMQNGRTGYVYGGLTLNECQAMPDDRGWMSINGIDLDENPDGTSIEALQGPFISSTNTYWNVTGSEWKNYSTANKAFWQLVMDDGNSIGQTNHQEFTRSFNTSYYGSDDSVNVQGNTTIKQTFVQRANRQIRTIRMPLGFKAQNTSTAAMTVRLKNSSGTTLSTATIGHSSALVNRVNSGRSPFVVRKFNAKQWLTGTFNVNYNLVAGQTYYFEFSSASGAGWLVSAIEPAPEALKTNAWAEQGLGGVALRSTDGGSTYGRYTLDGAWAYRYGNRYLSHLVTYVGYPDGIPKLNPS